MCKGWFKKQPTGQTVEEIIAESSKGMSEDELGKYYYELNQMIFKLVGEVELVLIEISASDWVNIVLKQYPTLTNLELPDVLLYTTTLERLETVLKRDWTNRIKYLAEKFDCDDFAHMLSERLNYYYGLTSVMEVWGNTTAGYHAFNVVVVRDGTEFIARLIEPQSDMVFETKGTLGTYTPKETK